MCQRERDRTDRTRESEGDREGWMDGQMSSVRSIRKSCSRHKRTGRRLEEIPVTNTTDVGRSPMNQQAKNLSQPQAMLAVSTEDC